MLVAAAVCPHPPLLVPEVATGAATELDGVRNACRVALRRMLGADTHRIVVVGGGPATTAYGSSAGGSLADYGVGIRVGPGDAVLPLSLAIGRWLVETWLDTTIDGRVSFHGVAENASPRDCLALGTALGAQSQRVGMLVMGDGSACRDAATPPEAVDPRARMFDMDVARALASADASALARLDAGLAGELSAAGRSAWQVLAGAAGERRLTGELLAQTSPYGVEYLVASWVAAG